MIKTALCFVVSFAISAACITTVRYASADAGVALIEPMPDAALQGALAAPAPVAAPAVTVNAGSGATVTVEAAKPLPDPIEQPGEALGLIAKLYRGGWLVPMCILLAFFALQVAEKKIAWLRIGWRKVAVASVMGALTLLAAPASEGRTPNGAMLFGALMAAGLLAVKSYGEPKPDPAKA